MHLFGISTSKSVPGQRCSVFWLEHLLRATAACNCWSLIWPDVSAPAALASLLCEPPGPQNMEETHCFATFLPFRAAWLIFFLLTISLLWSSSPLLWLFPPRLRHLSILSEVWPLNFLRPPSNVARGDVENLVSEFSLLQMLRCDPVGHTLLMTFAKTTSKGRLCRWRWQILSSADETFIGSWSSRSDCQKLQKLSSQSAKRRVAFCHTILATALQQLTATQECRTRTGRSTIFSLMHRSRRSTCYCPSPSPSK